MQKNVILGMSRDHFRPRTGRGLTISKKCFFQPIRISYAHLFLNKMPTLKIYIKWSKMQKTCWHSY